MRIAVMTFRLRASNLFHDVRTGSEITVRRPSCFINIQAERRKHMKKQIISLLLIAVMAAMILSKSEGDCPMTGFPSDRESIR